MFDVVGSQQRQFHGASDTVISTQRRTLSCQPLAIDIGLDGIVIEINLVIHQFVTHHVHMTLQDNGLAVLHTLRSWFANDNIARFIHFGVQSVALAP